MNTVLRISEAASIGMHAAAYLAMAYDRPVTTAEMAGAMPVSRNHLQKVMQRLVHEGLVLSVRGPHGGFRLAEPPGQVSLLRVYEAIDGRLPGARCLFSVPVCDGKSCILGGLLESMSAQLRQYMSRKSLADLLGVYAKEGVKHEAENRQD